MGLSEWLVFLALTVALPVAAAGLAAWATWLYLNPLRPGHSRRRRRR
jgi:hypothetical protein